MENVILEEFGRKTVKHEFLGVFSADMIPESKLWKRLSKFSLIANLDEHNSPGTHFIAIFYELGKIEYFDSYGIIPFTKDIVNFIKDLSRVKKVDELITNSKQIQSNTSNFCGLYCLAFLLSKDLKLTSEEFASLFSLKLRMNDELVTYFIEKCIKLMK